MDDTVIKKSELVIDALQYAQDHGLDVQNEVDVRKILEVLDPNHTQNVIEFIELIKTSDVFMNMKAKELKAKLLFPALELTGDNSLMIGTIGYLQYIKKKGKFGKASNIKATGNLRL